MKTVLKGSSSVLLAKYLDCLPDSAGRQDCSVLGPAWQMVLFVTLLSACMEINYYVCIKVLVGLESLPFSTFPPNFGHFY